MARKTVFPFTVHLYGLTGSVGIWECWRNEIRLESRGCWATADVSSHLQAPTLPAYPLQILTEKRITWGRTRAEDRTVPCVLYTYRYTSRFLNYSMFSFSKWSSSTGYKVMESSRGMRKPGVTSSTALLPHLTCLGINGNNDKISDLKRMPYLPIFIETGFLLYFQQRSLNDIFF